MPYHIDEQPLTYQNRTWRLHATIDTQHVLLMTKCAKASVWTLARLCDVQAPCPNSCEDGCIYIQVGVDDFRREICPLCCDGFVALDEVL
jgi:hypothetical protein